MNKQIINPWTWQDGLGYAQAVEVKNGGGTLYCSGQAAIDADGKPTGGSMEAQIKLSLQNLEHVVRQAGYSLSGIVRLNFYTTSISEFFAAYGIIIAWMQVHKLTPASTLTEVSALAYPEMSIEIEATAVA